MKQGDASKTTSSLFLKVRDIIDSIAKKSAHKVTVKCRAQTANVREKGLQSVLTELMKPAEVIGTLNSLKEVLFETGAQEAVQEAVKQQVTKMLGTWAAGASAKVALLQKYEERVCKSESRAFCYTFKRPITGANHA